VTVVDETVTLTFCVVVQVVVTLRVAVLQNFKLSATIIKKD
jgi:hypothetical protein